MLISKCFAKDLLKGKTVFVTGGGSGNRHQRRVSLRIAARLTRSCTSGR